MSQTKILLSGYSNQTGRIVRELVTADPTLLLIGGFDREEVISNDFCVVSTLERLCANHAPSGDKYPDVIIDCSTPELFFPVWEYAIIHHIPLVTCTNLLGSNSQKYLERSGKVIPVFHSYNIGRTFAVNAIKIAKVLVNT